MMNGRSVPLRSALLAVVGPAAVGLTGCADGPEAGAQPPEAAPPPAAAAAPAPPYKPVATTLELMESMIAHAADEYWGSVRIVVDANGVTEYVPETDEEWEEVWAAAVTLAESGNLLMMPPRAIDEEWIRVSGELVDVGVEAASAALARDTEAVLAVGERIYNVCVECHERFIPNVAP